MDSQAENSGSRPAVTIKLRAVQMSCALSNMLSTGHMGGWNI